jgi:hypothetical protein
MTFNRKEWLNTLQVGQLAIAQASNGQFKRIVKIEQVTKRRIRTKDFMFSKFTGVECGVVGGTRFYQVVLEPYASRTQEKPN